MPNYLYFSEDEFKCKCGCGLNITKHKFIKRLDRARKISNVPFKINSGTRCEAHNKSIGGVPNSEHVTGEGVDICARNSQHRFRIVMALLKVGFTRIGIAKDFIHVGISKNKSQRVFWLY